MDLGALDGALDPWRRERELQAWERVQALRDREAELRARARTTRLVAGAALGKLGEHVSAASSLEVEADALKAKQAWWRRCRLTVRPYEERRRSCGEWAVEGTCQHCGVVHAWKRACGATMVCADCRRARSKRLTRKLLPAIRLNEQRALFLWHARGRQRGQRPALTMMTLTLRSVDVADLAQRRRVISAAWNRFRSWWQGKTGRKLSYAWTAECTDGASNQGHVHLHVLTMLPQVDFVALSAQWDASTDGLGGHIQFSRSRKSAKSGAAYLAKYASKGVQFASVQTAAAWVRAQHGKRAVSTSRDWWLPDESKCGPWALTLSRTPQTMGRKRAHGTTREGRPEYEERVRPPP